jgi:hypothetical protein
MSFSARTIHVGSVQLDIHAALSLLNASASGWHSGLEISVLQVAHSI